MKKSLYLMILPFFFTMATANAHSLWLNLDSHQAGVGQAVRLEIGWGHRFPKDEVIKEGFLNLVYALDSEGTKIPLDQKTPTEFEFMPTAEGTYILLANIHQGFLSKTTEGYKLQSKKGLENVVFCFRYDLRAKAFLQVGDGKEMPDQPAGDPLEIMPQKDPGELKEGENLPVKVLFGGKALPSVEVRATYEGFTDQPNTFAISTMTDKAGVARIRILKRGRWLVNVVHEIPYPKKEECDKYRYNCCFTFEVR